MPQKTQTVLSNQKVPSGDFGDFETEGNPPASLRFTNKGRVSSRVAIYGSNDGDNWEKIGKVKAGPGKTRLKKLKLLPLFVAFHNARASSGPATLEILSSI